VVIPSCGESHHLPRKGYLQDALFAANKVGLSPPNKVALFAGNKVSFAAYKKEE
jgi:hypothetical protein